MRRWGGYHPMATFVYRFGQDTVMRETTVEVEIGDNNFLPFYQMRLLAGKNISSCEHGVPVLINETYARLLGFNNPSQAVGMQLYHRENNLWYTIVGVVKDYHQRSFHETIRPLIIISWLS